MVIDRYLIEGSASDGYLLEDGSGVLLLESSIQTTFLEPGGDATFNVALTTAGGFWSGSGGTPTVVSDFVHGSHLRSLRFPSGGTHYTSKNSVLSDTGSRISFYTYLNGLPSGNNSLIELYTDALALRATLRVTSSGVLQLIAVGGAQIGADGATLASGQWYRISLAYIITSTTVNRFEVFVDGVSSISATDVTLSSIGITALMLGTGVTTSTGDIRISDIYVDNGNSLADPGDIWVTAKRPTANGLVNAFDVQIGAGGSGYGTGHAPQINERALSTTNGWSVVNVSGIKFEIYDIEGISTGDFDLTDATIVDTVAWAYANSLVSQTGFIITEGVGSLISLTSTNTMFTKVADLATYPVGDYGIATDSTTATTVSLFETGAMVAFIPGVEVSEARLLGLMGVGM